MNNFFRKKNKHKNYSGFTFLELMIVISIVGILSVISIISFSSVRKNTNINASLDEVSSFLNLAKGFSLQGRMPDGFRSICGYGFRFIDTAKYEIFYYYPADRDLNHCGVAGNIRTGSVNMQNLKANITLKSPAPASSVIYFSIPRATVNTSINFVITNGSMDKTISINTAGLIQ